jgi:hypothetical protein
MAARLPETVKPVRVKPAEGRVDTPMVFTEAYRPPPRATAELPDRVLPLTDRVTGPALVPSSWAYRPPPKLPAVLPEAVVELIATEAGPGPSLRRVVAMPPPALREAMFPETVSPESVAVAPPVSWAVTERAMPPPVPPLGVLPLVLLEKVLAVTVREAGLEARPPPVFVTRAYRPPPWEPATLSVTIRLLTAAVAGPTPLAVTLQSMPPPTEATARLPDTLPPFRATEAVPEPELFTRLNRPPPAWEAVLKKTLTALNAAAADPEPVVVTWL